MTPAPDTSAGVRLVVADVDGTLVTPDKVVTPLAHAVVHELREAGIAFTITSGRPPRGMKMLIDELEVQQPVAAFNGALFVAPDLSVVRERPVEREVVPRVIDILTSGGLDVLVYAGTEWRVRSRHGPHVDLLMFARSGTSIAMANASTEVQSAATFVTSSNTDEGFARAMERWVLPRAGHMRSHISDRVAPRSAPGLS